MSTINPVMHRWYEDARRDPDAFWARAAAALPWLKSWDRVFEWTFPTFRWFIGGETNLAYNALDHHVEHGRGGHAALVYLNERGERQVFTYAQLLHAVTRAAAALRGLGIRKGDRITISMPTSPEAITLMLATVRIGAIHSIVFAGFGANALGDRIRASGSRLVFTADITYRKGKNIPLKPIVDEALRTPGHDVEHVIVLERERNRGSFAVDRDMTWDAFLEHARDHSGAHVPMESNEPAFILATSGTTARPKLAIHTHGGYQVHITSMGRWCFGLKPDDVWWSTSDIGWIVGHSYMVYAPLLTGCTTVAFEGALDHPTPDAHWRTVVEEFGATGIFTSPTAVRMLMRYGEHTLRDVDHRRLERVVCAGEVLNPHAWEWLQNVVLGGRAPVIDHMWQTETGGPVFGNPYGIAMLPIKPGASGPPLPGIEADIVTVDGESCRPNEKGIMVLKRPFPGMTPNLWGEPERYAADYWRKIPNVYYSGDSAHVDEDGYYWFAGRADEVIKIAAHRIGTIEVESAFLKHPAVAETGAVGRPDELRGEVIAAFVVLKQGHSPSPKLKEELIATVRAELGPVAVIGDLNFVR
ncbi:MAG TPA: AMP-binding protein, partial [Gemmatimonadaceae bacterium]|nr:AMP-binding protein [Gemmatimonadaceae bacterium]